MKKVAAAGVLVVVMGLIACGSETTNGSGSGGTMSGSSSSGMSSSSGVSSSSGGGMGGSGACATAQTGATTKSTCKTICDTDLDCCLGQPGCPSAEYPLNARCDDLGNGIKVCRTPECCSDFDCGGDACVPVNGFGTCVKHCSSDAGCINAKCTGVDDNAKSFCTNNVCDSQTCNATGEVCGANDLCECANLLQACSATRVCAQ